MTRTSGKKPPPSLAQGVRVERSESTRGIRRSEATLTWWKFRRKGVLEKERGWQNTHPCASDVRWKSSQDEAVDGKPSLATTETSSRTGPPFGTGPISLRFPDQVRRRIRHRPAFASECLRSFVRLPPMCFLPILPLGACPPANGWMCFCGFV